MRCLNFYPLISFLIFGLMITGRIIFLKKMKVSAISKVKKSLFTKYILYPIFLLILFLLIFELTKPAFQISTSILPGSVSNNLMDSIFLKLAGAFLITIALLLLGLTLLSFNQSLRFGMDSNNPGKLITKGIFSISRNPFFVSIEIYFSGIALLQPNLFLLVLQF